MKQHPPPPEAIPTTPPSVWPRWFVESLLPKPGRNQGGARMPQLKGIKKHQPLDATFASSMRFLLSCRPGEVGATCDLARGFPILKNHVDHIQSIFWEEVPSFEIPPYKLAILESLLYNRDKIRNHCHSPQTVLHGWGIKKKLIRGSKKIIPRGSKKNYYEDQKKLFTWIETLSCGRGAKIASLTGSKKIIRPGSLPKNDMKNCTQFWQGTFPRQNVRNTLCSDHCWKFGRAQRLPPRRIADDHDGGLCFEPVVVPASVVVVPVVVPASGCCSYCPGAGAGGFGAVRGGNLQKKNWMGVSSLTTRMVVLLLLLFPLWVFSGPASSRWKFLLLLLLWKGGVLVAVVDAPVEGRLVVVVVVVHGCCGYCGWCWCWCWWFWCRERRQPLKNKKAGGGLGGRAQRLPPRCIADDHDGGLCFEPVVVPASGCFQVPPPPDEILLLSLLERRCSCCCCRCSGGGPPKKSSCCSLLLWILWMVLVLVALVPWEEATLKNKKAGGGLGGRAQRLPPRRIADDHDGGLCFEPVAVGVVVVVVVVVAILEKAAQSKATATISTFKTEKKMFCCHVELQTNFHMMDYSAKSLAYAGSTL